MKFEHTKIFNFDGAFRGLRNPLESWDKSDSNFKHGNETNFRYDDFIGSNDLNLAQRMIKGGTEQSKFLRQIFVSVDITAPLYWWKQFDTYKIGTVANSTSTMHKLASTPITINCFETDDYDKKIQVNVDTLRLGHYESHSINNNISIIIELLENLRKKYLETKDIRYWKELIRWLPESWLQTRTITLNYAVLRNIIHQRKSHKLQEWSVKFIEWCHSLPYAEELLFYEN